MQKVALAAVAAVILWAGYAMLNNLGSAPLQMYDEGTYAQVVSESLDRGDFMTFTLGYREWFEKPPLYFWFAGATTALTHDAALGIRLPAALAGILVVAMTMLLVYQASRNLWFAAASGTLLLLTPPFIQGAREARLDLLVALFILCATYAAWRRWYIWFGVAVALAFLSKSIIAVFAVVPLLVAAAYWRNISCIYDKKFWLGVVVALAIVLPWHVYEFALYGNEFLRNYVGVHLLERYETNLFGDPRLQTNYTAHLFWFAPLLTGLSLISTVITAMLWRRLRTEERAALAGLFLTGVVMLAVFYTAQTRAFSYLLPLYPFAAAFVALSFRLFISRSVH